MPMKNLYVIARSASGRPTLQHKLVDGTASVTCCGRVMDGWSRAFMTKRIDEVLCLSRACRS